MLKPTEEKRLAEARATFDLCHQLIGRVMGDIVACDRNMSIANENPAAVLENVAQRTASLSRKMEEQIRVFRIYESAHGVPQDQLTVSDRAYAAARSVVLEDLLSIANVSEVR